MGLNARLTRFLVAAAVLVFCGGMIASAPQAAEAKGAIDIPFPSKVGDRARYDVTYTKTGVSGASTATIDVTMEITRADEAGFLITWTYGKFQAGSPGRSADPDGQKVMDLLRSVRLVLQVNPRAVPTSLKLVNWEELQTRLAQGRDELRKQLQASGMNPQALETLDSFVGSIYQNRDVMTAYYTKEAFMFFSLLGKRIPLSGTPESDMELPNPFGGDPFPGRGRLSVKSYDEPDHRAVVLNTAALDSARVPEIFEKLAREFMAKLTPGLSGTKPEGSLFKNLSIGAETEFDFDLTSAWPESVVYKTSVTIEIAPPGGESPVKSTQVESISMKRIKG
jgi:hypothetical protein